MQSCTFHKRANESRYSREKEKQGPLKARENGLRLYLCLLLTGPLECLDGAPLAAILRGMTREPNLTYPDLTVIVFLTHQPS